MAAAGIVLAGCGSEGPLAPPAFECFRIADPYAAPGSWYRGNFHMHSLHSDGALNGPELVDLYRRHGYTALCVSDHNQYGDQDGGALPLYQADEAVHDWNGDGVLHPEWNLGSGVEAYVRDWDAPPVAWARDTWYRPERVRWDDAPVMLTGAEVALGGLHVGLVGLPPGTLEQPGASAPAIERTREAGGFVTLAHPGEWNARPGDLARILDLRRFQAVEIMNGLRLTKLKRGTPVMRPAASGDRHEDDLCIGDGPADATALWDGLLSRGYRLWGIANDDAHTPPGYDVAYPFTAFDMVRTPDPSAEGFLAALHAGSFYGSTGLFFRELGAAGDSVVAWAPGAQQLRFIGWGGRLLAQAAGERAAYACTGGEGYVRVEATGSADATNGWPWQAWSQPFYIESAPCQSGVTREREGS